MCQNVSHGCGGGLGRESPGLAGVRLIEAPSCCFCGQGKMYSFPIGFAVWFSPCRFLVVTDGCTWPLPSGFSVCICWSGVV